MFHIFFKAKYKAMIIALLSPELSAEKKNLFEVSLKMTVTYNYGTDYKSLQRSLSTVKYHE